LCYNEAVKSPERLIPFSIFVVSLAIFSLARVQLVSLSSQGPRQARALTGDEPSYLLITHSLVADGDLNLYNQCIQRDSRFFGIESCGGHAARRDLNKKEVYSIHLPGLPILLAPAYALALRTHISPRAMVCLFMNLLAALLAAQVYLLCREMSEPGDSMRAETKQIWPAILSTAAVALTPPVIFYSNLVYPELPAALLILYAFRHILLSGFSSTSIDSDNVYRSVGVSECGSQCTSLLSSDAVTPSRRFAVSPFRPLAVSLSIAFLPWLSFRFLLPAIILLLMLILEGKGKMRGRTLFSVFSSIIFLCSIALFFGYQHRAFGTYKLTAGYEYQGFAGWKSLAAGGVKGLLGVILDQGHGMLSWSPVYLLSFTGLVLLARERPSRGMWIILVLLSVYLPEATYMHWWGGFAPPPRYIVVPAPFLGGALCYALCRIHRLSFRMVFGALLVLSLTFGFMGCAYPLNLYRHEHILGCFNPEIICRIFPALLHSRRSTWPLAALWITLIIGVTGHYTAKRDTGVAGDSERL